MKNDRIPSTFEVKCKCGKYMTIRTKEPIHTEPCWQCGIRQIKIVLGAGKNNYSVYILEQGKREERISPISVIQ